MYGRGQHNISIQSQCSEDEHEESSSSDSTLVMLMVHNLDHMMQPHEWEILLKREIHGARILGVSVIREQSSSRPWGEGELTAYILTRHDAPLIRQYLHNRRLGFRRLHVDAVTSNSGIEVFLVHKILQLLKLNPQMSDVVIEQRISSFFRRFPSSVHLYDYDRTTVMRLIHECMGLPVSPPVTSDESEIEEDSPSVTPLQIQLQPTPASQQQPQNIPIQLSPQQEKSIGNPQLIIIDERTMQLHFTPFYFDLLEVMSTVKSKNEYVQLPNTDLL
ncbi:unnamed protein product [Rotaria socialis]|uniref:Uncharacterized protein n=1 Tax=Rotaria socialis TaxID=392032 RepID=A0A821AZM5_9BILA|nr:unnamed protein product [Rotaria socialis]CAF4583636.1 unnamed protein product [Rotaria socialis]